jgi:hypothetical protein
MSHLVAPGVPLASRKFVHTPAHRSSLVSYCLPTNMQSQSFVLAEEPNNTPDAR